MSFASTVLPSESTSGRADLPVLVPELASRPSSASPAPAPSSHDVGSGGNKFPAGPPAIDLRMNAEIVLSGRAQPGQTIQLNGQWITVNSDGTFTVRLALPIARG